MRVLPGQVFDSESGLFQNHHREYQALKGGYTQTDPIGLQGGINTYSYVSSNPLGAIDPRGLVEWNGTVLSGGVGPAGGDIYTLQSECKCGKKVTARVRTVFFGISMDMGFSYTGQTVSFKDAAGCPSVSTLLGQYARAAIGGAAGAGYSCSFTTLGRAHNASCGLQAGFELGAGLSLAGASQLLWVKEEPCDDCQK